MTIRHTIAVSTIGHTYFPKRMGVPAKTISKIRPFELKPTTAGGRLEAPGGAGGQAPEAPPEAADRHVAARARQKALLTPY